MSTQHTPGALSAAKEIQQKINAACDRLGIQRGRDEAQLRGIVDMAIIIDRLAVKPATAELLAALEAAHNQLVLLACEEWTKSLSAERLESVGVTLKVTRAAIAQHEART